MPIRPLAAAMPMTWVLRRLALGVTLALPAAAAHAAAAGAPTLDGARLGMAWGLPFAALLAAVFVTFDRWRRGVFVLGSALLLGSLLRALLPSERAGLLQVRGRAFDSALMASAGVAILWLATSIDSLGTDSLQ